MGKKFVCRGLTSIPVGRGTTLGVMSARDDFYAEELDSDDGYCARSSPLHYMIGPLPSAGVSRYGHKITITVGFDSVDDAKLSKNQLDEIIETWAEKSRHARARGWRLSALDKSRVRTRGNSCRYSREVYLWGTAWRRSNQFTGIDLNSRSVREKELDILREGIIKYGFGEENDVAMNFCCGGDRIVKTFYE